MNAPTPSPSPSPTPSSLAGPDGNGRRLSPTARLLVWWGLLAVAGLVAFVAVRATTSDEPAASPVTTAAATAGGAPGSSTVTTAVSPLPAGASTSAPAPSEAAAAPAPVPAAAPASTTSSVAPGDVPEDRSTDGGPPDWVSEDGCDPGYLGTCIPRPPAKVTCNDISETNFQVLGNDAQGLDPDGNGMACEQLNNQPNPNRTPEEMREFEKVD